MYLINRSANRIQALTPTNFASLGFHERAHIQEWIAADPTVLGEDLLIIQKEFDDWDATNERLDLLAIDKQGRLVLIENKRDDSGKDVNWQAIKYAAYCSSLSRDDVVRIAQDYFDTQEPGRDAAAVIAEFLDADDLDGVQINEGASQRVFMLATRLRREVTATALWLSNFGIDVRCFKLSPFLYGDEALLSIEQVIPVPEAQDFMIGVSKKRREEEQTRSTRKQVDGKKKAFWVAALAVLHERGVSSFEQTKATERNFISKAAGVQSTTLELGIAKHEARVMLYINTGDADRSNKIFEFLMSQKDEIERRFGSPLVWDRNEGSSTAQVRFTKLANFQDEESWPETIDWMADTFKTFKNAFDPAIKHAARQLQKSDARDAAADPTATTPLT